MDKLISANSITQKLIPVLVENGDMCLLGKIISIVYSEPAAFDKEKVVKGLEFWKNYSIEWVKKYKKDGCEEKAKQSEMAANAYGEAIKEVEKGGVEE